MVGRGSERAGRGMWPAVLSSRAAEVVVRAWRPRSTRIITAGYALGLSDALVSSRLVPERVTKREAATRCGGGAIKRSFLEIEARGWWPLFSGY